MNLQQLRNAELEWVGVNPFNKRVGDFSCLYEASPSWVHFYDGKDNRVIHGGQGCQTDVVIELKGKNKEVLKERLFTYMRELVSRHQETLHEEGRHQFHAVTIDLPYNSIPDNRYVIHTGSGCCYDQDEIAYEVMAALSNIPVYKALAPRYSYYDFIRIDDPLSKHPVTFYHQGLDVMVFFSHENDDSFVYVYAPKTEELENYLFAMFSGFIAGRTGNTLARRYETSRYEASNPHDGLTVKISTEFNGTKCLFGMKLPYNLSFEDFPRLKFAKLAMESISKDFPQVEQEQVE